MSWSAAQRAVAVLAAEERAESLCRKETAIGAVAYKKASTAVRDVFGASRKRSELTYDVALKELSDKNDKAAKAAKAFESYRACSSRQPRRRHLHLS